MFSCSSFGFKVSPSLCRNLEVLLRRHPILVGILLPCVKGVSSEPPADPHTSVSASAVLSAGPELEAAPEFSAETFPPALAEGVSSTLLSRELLACWTSGKRDFCLMIALVRRSST